MTALAVINGGKDEAAALISNRLPVLVAKVRALHEAAMAAARTSLAQAAACGRLLTEAKEAVYADCPVLTDVSRYPAQCRSLIF
jgi:hypothetical protein